MIADDFGGACEPATCAATRAALERQQQVACAMAFDLGLTQEHVEERLDQISAALLAQQTLRDLGRAEAAESLRACIALVRRVRRTLWWGLVP